MAGVLEADWKARLVACNLKHMRHVDLDKVYAPLPGSGGFRSILATANPDEDCFSSTDFETAYLQADHWEEDMWMLLVYYDPETD